MAKSEPDNLNSISTNPRAKKTKTITITIPSIKKPQVNIRDIISRAEAVWLIALLIIGIGGGFLGGWIESSQNKGSIYLSSTNGEQKLASSSNQLVIDIAKKLSASVVSISATTTQNTTNFFGFSQPIQQQSEGTGIIISSSGLILTNRHVVPAGTTSVSVTLNNGTQLNDVSVVGRTAPNDSLDIAMLKINNTQGQTLAPVVLGDSNDVQVGDEVVAIGNALGEFQNTVTSGIISGYGRDISASSSGGGTNLFGLPTSSSSENLNDLFQTDAAINEGNSGGPLVNLNGQVIGVNTAIASNSQNIGFAIPIDEVKGLIKEVTTTGKFIRPLLGVKFIPLTPAIAKQYKLSVNYGAYIPKGSGSIIAGSAAAKAGLKPGEIITKVNSVPINLQNDLTSLIDQYEPGAKITLTVVLGSNTKTITLKLGAMPNS